MIREDLTIGWIQQFVYRPCQMSDYHLAHLRAPFYHGIPPDFDGCIRQRPATAHDVMEILAPPVRIRRLASASPRRSPQGPCWDLVVGGLQRRLYQNSGNS